MDREELRRSLLVKLEADTGETIDRLDDNVDLRAELGLDSVDFVQLVIHIQSQYGILLESKDLENVSRVGELLDLLQTKLAMLPKRAAA
jgi:acyl carrier protein